MSYHIHINGQTNGPFTEDEILDKLAAGEITEETQTWKEGTADWVPLSQLKLKGDDSPATAVALAAPVAQSGTGGLQFDQAEFKGTAKTGLACSACGKLIQDSYFQVNENMFCPDCREAAEAGMVDGSGFGRFARASLAGGIAAAVGSGIYFAILKLTGYEFGLVAIVVGLMVGGAVRWGANGRGGWLYQGLAIFLTYCSIVTTYVPFVLEEMDKGGANEVPFLIKLLIAFPLAFVTPFLAGFSNIIGWVIIGIGLYQAWRINRHIPIEVKGPFRVGAVGPQSVTG